MLGFFPLGLVPLGDNWIARGAPPDDAGFSEVSVASEALPHDPLATAIPDKRVIVIRAAVIRPWFMSDR